MEMRLPVDHFEPVLRAISARTTDPFVLIGGQAVNAWALAYAERLGPSLRPLQPLTSMDLDLWATRQALIDLSQQLRGKLFLSGPREVTEGSLMVEAQPHPLRIDVLRSIHGLQKLDRSDTISLDVCGHQIHILFPHLLLQAKLANAAHLDQKERQDIKHVKLMTLVTREFLRDVVLSTKPSEERVALKLLQLTNAIGTSPDADAFSKQHSFPFVGLIPKEEILRSELGKLKAFLQGQLQRSEKRFSREVLP
jgi:hypothetical protein